MRTRSTIVLSLYGAYANDLRRFWATYERGKLNRAAATDDMKEGRE